MKNILALFLLLLTSNVFADCLGGGLSVTFPNTSTIKKNSIFVLEGRDGDISVILELNKKYSIYLMSGRIKIKLLVTEICRGNEFDAQAILRPETELEIGREYVIKIDSLSSENSYLEKKFIVGKERDLEKPLITSKPILLEKRCNPYGCGPSILVIFSSPATGDSSIIVKTTVKSMKSGKETIYYIIPRHDKLFVGRGNCGGPFNFMDGDTFEATFSVMDDAGNMTAIVGEPVSFTKPVPEN